MKFIYNTFLCFFLLFALHGCKDKWEDHNAIVEQNLNRNLQEQLLSNPELSTFLDLIKKAGLESMLTSSKSYTIWAPTNQALANLDQDLVNDVDSLRKFVFNHMAMQNYFVESYTNRTVRLLSGKNVDLNSQTVNGHPITSVNNFVRNGVIHVISEPNAIVDNIYEFIQKWNQDSRIKNFLATQKYIGMDSTIAEVIAVDPDTGEPIFLPGSGEIERNHYFDQIANLGNEDRKYTFILLKDVGYQADFERIKPFYHHPEVSKMDSIVNWHIVKDLAFDTLYTEARLNDSIYAIGGLKVKVDKNKILEKHNLSNGVVYVLNSLDYILEYNKIKPIVIQAERFEAKRRDDRTPLVRNRRDPFGVNYTDIFLENHGTSEFWFRYMPVVNSVKYKVAWRAPRDYNLTGTITYSSMAVAFNRFFLGDLEPISQRDTINPLATLPYVRIELQNYNEVDVGEYTPVKFGKLNTAIVGAAVTTNAQNTIVLDYLKLIPVFTKNEDEND